MARLRELQRRIDDLFLRPPSAEAVAAPPGVRFSPFVPAHVEGALELVDRWIFITHARGRRSSRSRRSRSGGPGVAARAAAFEAEALEGVEGEALA